MLFRASGAVRFVRGSCIAGPAGTPPGGAAVAPGGIVAVTPGGADAADPGGTGAGPSDAAIAGVPRIAASATTGADGTGAGPSNLPHARAPPIATVTATGSGGTGAARSGTVAAAVHAAAPNAAHSPVASTAERRFDIVPPLSNRASVRARSSVDRSIGAAGPSARGCPARATRQRT